jgi:hypothetical protein
MRCMLAPGGINDDDVRHAHRILAVHVLADRTMADQQAPRAAAPAAPARCRRCGGYYPCVPSRIAATVLAASLTPSSR